MSKPKTLVAKLALVLAILMLAAACANAEKNTNETNEGNPPADESSNPSGGSSQDEEPIQISWLSWNGPEGDDSPVQQYLEERFNVKIKNVRLERAQWQQQLNIKLAAKEIPDVFWLWSSEEIDMYAKQGVLAELPVDLIKEKMPRYSEDVDQGDPNLWKYALVEGESYAIPLYWPDGQTPFLPGYNESWLKAIGYDHPPTTLEEFEDVLYKFRNDDPDGNGVKDTYGMTARAKDALPQAFNVVFNAFGIVPPYDNMFFYDQEDNITFSMITEEARQAFKLLHKWYEDGVIDPEFITTDYTKMRQDFANGRVGVIDPGLWYHHQNVFEPEFKAVNPEQDYVVGQPLNGPNGEPGKGLSYGLKNNYIGMGIQVEGDTKKRDKIFEILEALATDEETYLMASYGREGIDYTMEDGGVVPIPEYVDSQVRGAEIGAGPYYGLFMTKSFPMLKHDLPKVKSDYKSNVTEGVPTFSNAVMGNVPELAAYPDLKKLSDSYFMKFILGEVDLDKGFDDFVELWKKSGGQEVLEAAGEVAQSLN
ncbi:extracellular solute-binding protein [Paenibacillus sp. IB182496]|uniref:Extracellular solute-binding protein n=1 Tax=Paenibacillus sabuli TaxID=2772509 RepID=A0A927GUB2_9BACL|nr:extracellular solute-binding protein [Paenibacillus sabuli]MBD2847517.1 extracellular solute-binding protein [Paenibacillus sabuli]